MPKARLNKKQRAWVEKFKQQHPYCRVRDIYEDLSGDRIVVLHWSDSLPKILVPGCSHSGMGWVSHELKVKLRIFGDPRYEPQHKYEVIYPFCPIDHKKQYLTQGQLQLELHQLNNVEEPKNPVKVKPRSSSKTKPKPRKLTQLGLPLSGIAAQLHRINLSKNKQVVSEQELLSEITEHRDLETGKEVKLPAAIIEILKDKNASLQEWDNAICLYQVTSSSGVIAYLEGLDTLRHSASTNQVSSYQKSSPHNQPETVKIVPQQ